MRRSALSLMMVATFAVLGVGIIWFPGYEPYDGPDSVTCSVGLRGNPIWVSFPDPVTGTTRGVWSEDLSARFLTETIPVTQEAMTVREAAERARFDKVDLKQYSPSVERWAVWSSRRATNRRLSFMSDLVRRVPIEVVHIWWEEYSKGRGYESCDYDELPSSEVTWEMPVKAGDQILLRRD